MILISLFQKQTSQKIEYDKNEELDYIKEKIISTVILFMVPDS